jgi:Fe-S-cluster containining protein
VKRHGSSRDWYEDGLRFRCTRCGNCCTGAPGAVWVSAEEIAALADWLGASREAFERSYVRAVGGGRSLLERFGGDCVFYDARARGCTVYEARPVQCRAWPFWDANVASPGAWDETARACPGAGRGELVSADEIQRRAREREDAKRRAHART